MRSRVQVRYGRFSFLLPAVLIIVGCVAWAVHEAAAKAGAVPMSPLPPAAFVAWFTLLYLLSLLAHEAGHVTAFRFLGVPWLGVSVGAVSIAVNGGDRTNRQQLLISAAGPLLGGLCGVLLLTVDVPWSLVWLAGMMAMIDTAANLLLPLRSSDGARLARAAVACVRGRGAHLL